VVALDFRGHGSSDHPKTLSPHGFREDLQALLLDLGAPDAVLVGHSLGAHTALEVAATQPGAAGLVLVDPGRGAAARQRSATRLALLLTRSYATREQAIARFRFVPAADAAEESLRVSIAQRSVRLQPDGRFGFHFDPRWIQVLGGSLPDLSRVRCPVLLVRGARSPLLTEEGARELVAQLPHCRRVDVEEAGHHVLVDQPQVLVRLIQDFLEEIRG